MRVAHKVGSLVFLVSLIISPVFVLAQNGDTASTTTATTTEETATSTPIVVPPAPATTTPLVTPPSTSSIPADGSSEAPAVRREQINNFRRQSSDTQQKINSLSSVAVAQVYMPVLFGVTLRDISPNFGAPRSGGRSHEGEDIMAVKGTPIVSPTQAVVIRTGVGVTEGNYVYTANPGGETFVYMHLDRIGEGVASGVILAQGALIGYVGNTGNASGGAAHLHFEIHNSSNNPVDPFPRLAAEFSLQDKINYLSTIFTKTSDPVGLSSFLVGNFHSTFVAAQAANIVLPPLIVSKLASMPIPVAGELGIGSSGSAVVTLQQSLINANTGPAARNLAAASATGYFGPITQAALVEYRLAHNSNPPPALTPVVITPTPTAPPAAGSISLTLTRDLFEGLSGEDVRSLQRTLNLRGFTVATSGPGSPASETSYFGPATRNAVIRFQLAKGIQPPAGRVGPITRAHLSAI